MVLINYANRTVNCKIVYYGPGEGGKTTNLRYIYDQLDASVKSEMICLEGLNERTVFFDFLSLDLGEVKGFNTRFGLYTSPGQQECNAARRLVLNGADGVIFVVDSQAEKLQENIESLEDLEENLKSYGLSMDNMPIVLQYNKQDLENSLDVENLEEKLNKNGYSSFETVASEGTGVFACLKAVSNLILTGLQ